MCQCRLRCVFVVRVFSFVGMVVRCRGSKNICSATIASDSMTVSTGNSGSYLICFPFEADGRFLDFAKALGGLLDRIGAERNRNLVVLC
jgi:hypothetical protein